MWAEQLSRSGKRAFRTDIEPSAKGGEALEKGPQPEWPL
jgi:hypothetical protein